MLSAVQQQVDTIAESALEMVLTSGKSDHIPAIRLTFNAGDSCGCTSPTPRSIDAHTT